MIKKTISLILSLTMILSLFISLPLKASADAIPDTATFSDGDLDRVYFGGDTVSFNLDGSMSSISSNMPVRVALGIVNASGEWSNFTVFNTAALTDTDPNYVFNGMGDTTGFYMNSTLLTTGLLDTVISGTLNNTLTLGMLGIQIYAQMAGPMGPWSNILPSPNYIILSDDAKPAMVGLDGVMEMPDGVT